MKRITALVGALVASAAIAACGTTSTNTGTTIKPTGASLTSTIDTNAYKTSRLTREQAGSAFLNAVEPVNAAINAASQQLQKLAAGQTADMTKVAAPAANALSKLNVEIESLIKKYPVGSDDLNNLEQSYQPLIVDLEDLKHVNRSNYKRWEKQFTKDEARVRTADKLVRSMLGLPQNH